MISKKFLALSSLFLISTVNATSVDNCTYIEKSASRGKAVVSETSVFAAVSASDVTNTTSRNATKDVKQKLQMMFVEYCRNFSGYKFFQITTKEGESGSVKCDGKTFYAFSVKKSNILISQLTSSNNESVLDIPELNEQKDIFEEFR
jgi:hypothetical protein